MPPSSAAALSIAALHDAVSVTSHSTAIASGPASAGAAASRSRRRARSATCAPRCPKPIAMQRPGPLDAPTTTALIEFLLAAQEAAFDEVDGRVDGAGASLLLGERIDECE